MPSLPYIDVHTHILHSKIASRVVAQLCAHYHVPCLGTGELDDCLPRMRRAGISQLFAHSAATTPEQVIPANRWALSLGRNPGVIPFGTMHPDFDRMDDELAFLHDNGIRGIKLHPDFQGFRLDDPALLPLFGAMEGRFTLMCHVGDLLPPERNPSCPYKLAAVKRRFPKLRIIAAHFGGVWHWRHVIEAYRGLDMLFDTSSSTFAIPQELLEQIFHAFPLESFLFGSDYPLSDPQIEMERLQYRLRLSDRQLETIMTAGNSLQLAEPARTITGLP